uniref:Uncharacterized protein n=1 Tax=Anguilla anguilla TaxID=7936 RepID=A0A0E9PR35_ANGAN
MALKFTVDIKILFAAKVAMFVYGHTSILHFVRLLT